MADIIFNDCKIMTPAVCPVAQDPVASLTTVTAATDACDCVLAPDNNLLPLVEMLFFAYRDFTGEADAALEAYRLGRAHHRVLHFVHRHPGIRVADLLELLKITKQSLGRVLRKLLADHWIEQAPGADDRRERHLTLTTKGRGLAAKLAALQTRRVDAALREIETGTGAPVRVHIQDFLYAMISQGERAMVRAIVNGAGGNASQVGKSGGIKKDPCA